MTTTSLQFVEVEEDIFCFQYKRFHSLDESSFPWPWRLNSWKSIFQDFNVRLFALNNVESDLSGFCLYSVNTLTLDVHLLKLLVAKPYLSLGYGKDLLNKSLSLLKNNGFETCFLEVSVKNEISIQLYSKAGFEILVRKRKFYSNGEDAYAMRMAL